MSLGRIQSIFENLDKCDAWSIQLLGIQTSKIRNTTYTGTSIRLTPDGKLNEFVKEIMNHYSDHEKGALKAFSGVQDYDGTTHADIIYKLDMNKLKVTEEYEAFTDAVNDPNEEGPLKDGKFDTSQKEAAGKLVKLLCNKGMVDPFEEIAGRGFKCKKMAKKNFRN